jgi:hypothetical protein
VAIIVVDENHFDDFIVTKNIRIRVYTINNWIGCLFPSRKSRIQGGDFLRNVTVIVDDGTAY